MKFTNFIKLVIATSAFSIAISSCGPSDDFIGISTLQPGDVVSGAALTQFTNANILNGGVFVVESDEFSFEFTVTNSDAQLGTLTSSDATINATGLSYNLAGGILLIQDDREDDASALGDIQSAIDETADDLGNVASIFTLVDAINNTFSADSFILDSDGASVVIVREFTVGNEAEALLAEGTEVVQTGDQVFAGTDLQLVSALDTFEYIVPSL